MCEHVTNGAVHLVGEVRNFKPCKVCLPDTVETLVKRKATCNWLASGIAFLPQITEYQMPNLMRSMWGLSTIKSKSASSAIVRSRHTGRMCLACFEKLRMSLGLGKEVTVAYLEETLKMAAAAWNEMVTSINQDIVAANAKVVQALRASARTGQRTPASEPAGEPF